MRTHGIHLFALSALLALSACGGGSNPDRSPDTFVFDPSHIENAVAGGTYTATATITGFDGQLPVRINGIQGDAVFKLLSKEGEAVDELSVSSGDTITLQAIVNGDAQLGNAISASVTVGEGEGANAATLQLTVVDSSPPQFSVAFPPPVSITPAETITLTGHWSEDSGEAVSLQLARNGQQIDMPLHMMFPDGTWQVDLPLDEGDNLIGLTATDSSGNATETVALIITRTDDAAIATAEQGLEFANPKELVLDAANDRLLAVSAKRVQGVAFASGHRGGHRGAHDLLQIPILRLGDAVLFEDDLWMSLYVDPQLGNLPVIARMPLNAIGSGDVPPNQLSGDFFHQPLLGRTSGLLVDENTVLVGIRSDQDAVYRIDRSTDAVESVLSAGLAGGNTKHLQRIDTDRFIHGDESDIELVDLGDPLNPVVTSILRPNVTADVNNVKSYAYDSIRKRLYILGEINTNVETQLGWVDLSDLTNTETAPVVEIVRTNGGVGGMPGYPTVIGQLYGFALDEKHERLFALSGLQGTDTDREVVVINLMAVAVDEDGDSAYDTDAEGNPVRKQTGETVLLSRSGPRDLP